MNYARDAKKIALGFLKDIFRERSDLTYKDDEDETAIIIADRKAVDLKTVGKRPLIITSRMPVAWNNVAIDRHVFIDTKTGAETYADLLSGTIIISCLSSVGVEAEDIADIVFKAFRYFRKELKRRGFFKIDSVTIGEEQTVISDAQADLTLVPVGISYILQDTWKVTPTGLYPFSRIDITGLDMKDDEVFFTISLSAEGASG